jgi:hypothetical protein
MRKTIVAGNWKMNASKESVNKLVLGILSGMGNVSSEVVVCAPFPYLSQVEALITHSQIKLGAQNLNLNMSGAFTGEVSAKMIKDFGAQTTTSELTFPMPDSIPNTSLLTDSLLAFIFQLPATIVFRIDCWSY